MGVEVSIVISETGAGAYSYGWTKLEALEAWRDVIDADPDLSDALAHADVSSTELLCSGISFASVRINDTDDTWTGETPMGNHSKFWIVDNRAFYVGSQNLYISNLFEWGLLVDDPTVTEEILDRYWTPLWSYAARSAVSGPAAGGSCVLN